MSEWLGQPAYYKKLHFRKKGIPEDNFVWKEVLKTSSDHGAVSQPIITHTMNYYGCSRDKAIEIIKKKAKLSSMISKQRGRDEGAYQQ